MSEWKLAWQFVPIPYGDELGILKDTTQKLFFRNNLTGTGIKIKFANLYNNNSIVLKQVTFVKIDRNNKKISEIKNVFYQGRKQIEILPGEAFYSDELEIPVHCQEDFMVSIYFKESTSVKSICCNWSKQTWTSSFFDGNQTMNYEVAGKDTLEILRVLDMDVNKCTAETGIWAVAVNTNEKVKTVALFGDSITHMSYYYDPLIQKLYEQYPGKITVINGGIAGNRLLFDAVYIPEMIGEGKLFGEAGIKRFERDLYCNTKPDLVFLMEGINDCTHGLAFHQPQEVPTAEMLWKGIEKVISLAHKYESEIYISTVMPFGCFEESFREQAEGIRRELNTLIRENFKIADGFLDLDKIMRKEEDEHLLKDGMHLGDGIHPNTAGGNVIAEAMIGKWFS